MPDSTATPLQHCTIDYLQDTLLGVNPLSHECTAQITESGEGLSLRILWPWPKELTKAHSITIKAPTRTYRGDLVDAQAFGSDELLLKIALQPGASGG